MKPTYHYTTVLEALDDLKEKGFHNDFNLIHEAIKENPHHFQLNTFIDTKEIRIRTKNRLFME